MNSRDFYDKLREEGWSVIDSLMRVVDEYFGKESIDWISLVK